MPVFSADRNTILPYLTDESSAFEGIAERVYFPVDAGEVAAILREASSKGIGVSVSGGGTSITGARVPTDGGWILATDRLRTVVAREHGGDARRGSVVPTGDGSILLDGEHLRARVPAGLRLNELDAAIAPHGLYYPPTLTETSAMIGGTIATNASGARSYHYGPTREWVDALTVVTAAGDVLEIRRGEHPAVNGRVRLPNAAEVVLPRLPSLREVKNAAGYYAEPDMDAIDLFIGGEGTLGVIVDAELRLARRPANAVSLLMFARERDAALNYSDAVRNGSLGSWTALAIEYFDANSLDFMRASYAEIPAAAAAVLVEIAPLDEPGDRWSARPEAVRRWNEETSRFDPVAVWAMLPTEREQVRLFRHVLPERVNDFVRTRSGKLGTDFAVPASNFRSLMAAYERAAAAGIHTVLFGHLGEYHLHLNFLARDAAEMDHARGLYTALARTAVDLGGTVSAEHGVGKKRIRLEDGETVPYLQLMYGEHGVREMHSLKKQLDPSWILNRNTLIPWEDRP